MINRPKPFQDELPNREYRLKLIQMLRQMAILSEIANQKPYMDAIKIRKATKNGRLFPKEQTTWTMQ